MNSEKIKENCEIAMCLVRSVSEIIKAREKKVTTESSLRAMYRDYDRLIVNSKMH